MSRHKLDANFTYGLSGEREFSLTAEYSYSPASRGARDGRYGIQLEPDESSSVTVHRVTGRRWGFDTKTGKHIEVGDEIDFTEIVCLEDLADEILREHEGEIEAARESAAEYRFEDWRDRADDTRNADREAV